MRLLDRAIKMASPIGPPSPAAQFRESVAIAKFNGESSVFNSIAYPLP